MYVQAFPSPTLVPTRHDKAKSTAVCVAGGVTEGRFEIDLSQ